MSLLLAVFFVFGNQDFQSEKVFAPKHIDLSQDGATLLEDYGSYRMYALPESVRKKMKSTQHFWTIPQMDKLSLRGFGLNSKSIKLKELRNNSSSDKNLHFVKFYGPLKDEWLQELKDAGAELVHYINRNGYLIWANETTVQRLQSRTRSSAHMTQVGPYIPYYRLDEALLTRAENRNSENETELIKVTIQLFDHPKSDKSLGAVNDLIVDQLGSWDRVLGYRNLTAVIQVKDISRLALLPDLIWAGEYHKRELFDEKQAQILVGNFNEAKTGPQSPGYLDWLLARGFSANPEDYPIVDITDDGIGNGSVISGDYSFHQNGDLLAPSRAIYVGNCTGATNGESVGGHGHINASIAFGYDQQEGFPYQDENGYQRALGLSPFGRFGGTRIFGPSFDLSACGNTDSGLIQRIYQQGARVSSNSWGCASCASEYDASSQAFDAGVRDADPDTPGNQELILLFSAGNSGSGPGTIGSPGNGKNMITVGATENDRSDWVDGCGSDGSNADNAMDMATFSSRGPAPGGRLKPEFVAPGTHIQGTASTSNQFNGTSVCDMYHPAGQEIMASSSGTSHSCPALAGVASLAYHWIQANSVVNGSVGHEPSPALMKAFLMAHSGSINGSGTTGLGDMSQGYGMPVLDQAFDISPRFLLDQAELLNESGDEYSVSLVVVDQSKPIRIALAYTDQPGLVGTTPQVNNLDLEVEINGVVYRGNHFSGDYSVAGGSPDPNNNYELVTLPPGTEGLIVRVRGFNIAGDGVPNVGDDTDQDFALAAFNATDVADFNFNAAESLLKRCDSGVVQYEISTVSLLGFGDAVSFEVRGLPNNVSARFSEVTVQPNQPTTLVLTIDELSAGYYPFELVARSTTGEKVRPLSFQVENQPLSITERLPLNDANEVNLFPVFSWSDMSLGMSYRFELATDEQFENMVFTSMLSRPSLLLSTRLDGERRYYWRVTSVNSCGELQSSVSQFKTQAFNDRQTELLEGSTVNNQSITFVPTLENTYERLCVEQISQLPIDPVNHEAFTLGDDSYVMKELANGFPFFGELYENCYIGSNGYITFGRADTNYVYSYGSHFEDPRVAGFFTDLLPSANSITFAELEDSVVVTYNDISNYAGTGKVTFQVQLYNNGMIQLSWINMSGIRGVVGLSPGQGLPDDFLPSDFSSESACHAFFIEVPKSSVVCENEVDIVLTPWLVSGEVDFRLTQLPGNVESSILNDTPVEGQVTIRLTGLSGENKIGLKATVAGTSVDYEILTQSYTITLPRATLSFPENGSAFDGYRAELKWLEEVTDARLVIASDSALNDIVFEEKVSGTSYLVNRLLPKTYYWQLINENPCTSNASEVFSFTLNAPIQYVKSGLSELSSRVIGFTPDGSASEYAICSTSISELPYDFTDASPISLSDDQYIEITPSQSFSFFGVPYDRFFIGSNGYITFGSGDSGYNESFRNHFNQPRISAVFDDLDPRRGGGIFYHELDDVLVITFFEISEYSSSRTNTFQVCLYLDGSIEVAMLDIQSTDGIFGLSNGYNPETVIETNFLDTFNCYCPWDVDGNQILDDGDRFLMYPEWNQYNIFQDSPVNILDLLRYDSLDERCH